MNRRHKYKKMAHRKQRIIPVLVEGEDYTILIVLLFVVMVAFFSLFSPRYAIMSFSFSYFLLAAWQLYSGIALTMLNWNKRFVAKYTQDREPSLFYLNMAVCFVMGIVAFMMSMAIPISSIR